MSNAGNLITDLHLFGNIRANLFDDTSIVTPDQTARTSSFVDMLPVGRVQSYSNCLDFDVARTKFRNSMVGYHHSDLLGLLGLYNESFLMRRYYQDRVTFPGC